MDNRISSCIRSLLIVLTKLTVKPYSVFKFSFLENILKSHKKWGHHMLGKSGLEIMTNCLVFHKKLVLP